MPIGGGGGEEVPSDAVEEPNVVGSHKEESNKDKDGVQILLLHGGI